MMRVVHAIFCCVLLCSLVARDARAGELDAPSITFTPYGFLNPTLVVIEGEPSTFGRDNSSALTAAGNPLVTSAPGGVSKTFQVAQSRIGVRIDGLERVQGTFEVDFIDFQKSTPTTAMQPRLRVASIGVQLTERDRIIAGELGDLHAYLSPFHTNIIGAHYQAGNSATTRLQVQWLHDMPALELGAAVGMPAANAGPVLSVIERSALPTAAVRLLFKPGQGQRVGLSGIVTQLEIAPQVKRLCWSGALLADVLWGELALRGEAYIGQNAANISLLTLSQGNARADVRDAGAWVSARYPLFASHRATLSVGMARLLNPEDAAPSYIPAMDGVAAQAVADQGPGMLQNIHARVGWVWTLYPGLDLALEPFWIRTTYLRAAQDSVRSGTATLLGAQSTLMYTF
jgi:hypothetical protein